MKKIIKGSLISLAVLVLLIAATPFALIQFGSDNAATSTKLILNAMGGYSIDSPLPEVVRQRLKVPAGFSISVYALGLEKVRFMRVTSAGDLLLSRPRKGDVLLLEADRDGDGLPDGQRVLLENLTKPHGLDVHDGWLYVAESVAVGRVPFDEKTGTINGDYQRIVDDLGDGGNHWTKTVGVGPDGWVYLSSGSTCNVCEEEDPRRAAMMRFKPDGADFEIYASGLRNSVGFDWAPWDQALYATDNGRDLLGDDFPPCELNAIVKDGFYGWPYINGFGELDPDLGDAKGALLATAISPAHGFRAHNAPLGMRFLRHSQSTDYQRTALVALHGSWNRTERDGYKVVSLHWLADGSIEERDFVTGFNGGGDVIGRPADVAEGLDGVIYVSDDYAGSIYRVVYGDAVVATPVTALATASVTTPSTTPARMVVDPQEALASYSSEQLQSLTDSGEQLFRRYACGNCHDAAQARPNVTVKELKGLPQRYDIHQLAEFFLTPTPPMPVFPLNEQEREALAVYLYAQSLGAD